MAKSKKKRRSSLSGGVRKVIKNSKKGRKYLNSLPDGISMFEPKGGKTYIFDIMPYIVKKPKDHPDREAIPEDVWYRYPYGLHRNIGPDDELIVCPSFIGKKCSICEEMKNIFNDEDGDDDIAKKLIASRRALYVIRMKSGPDKGELKILDISDHCFWKKIGEEIDMGDPEYENFVDMEGGYSLKVRFKEESLGKNKYPVASRVDFIERDDITEDELEESPCLDDLINVPTSKEVQSIFEGSGYDDEEEEDDDLDDDDLDDDDLDDSLDLTWEDLEEMDEEELLEVSEANELGFDDDTEEYDDEDDLRNLIAEELDIEKPKKKKKKTNKKKSKKKRR
jgi:hypothetical protein